MGRQIGILQSSKDEEDILAYLATKVGLRCIPSGIKDKTSLTYLDRIAGEDHKVLIVQEKHHDLIMSHLQNDRDIPGVRFLHCVNGLSVEWLRTGKYKNGLTSPGRFYFNKDSAVSAESAKEVERVYSMLYRHIRTTYPRRTDERYPRYLGPNFCQLLDAGKERYSLGPGIANPLLKS